MSEAETEDVPAAVPLLEPREGLPPVVADAAALAAVVERQGAGTGPVAVDAERASGYRYGQRAYLVQVRRAGAGTALIDPVACPDLSALSTALQDAEWVIHAATQDLPCLGEVGMRPQALFDTELAGRLAGYPRVALGTLVETLLGWQLEKGHSAADWSVRPLPEPWLRYAALDVEVLVDLRDALAEELRRQGKLDWAQQEFAAILAAPPAVPRPDPWRRTSGIHRVRAPRQLAAVRALWQMREAIARERDIAPGRVLPDAAIVAAALSGVTTADELPGVPGWTTRSGRRLLRPAARTLREVAHLSAADLPAAATPSDGPPPPARWADRDPAAAARLASVRTTLAALAETHRLPVENLLSPDTARRLAWAPPSPVDVAAVTDALQRSGARAWQIELTAVPLAEALRS